MIKNNVSSNWNRKNWLQKMQSQSFSKDTCFEISSSKGIEIFRWGSKQQKVSASHWDAFGSLLSPQEFLEHYTSLTNISFIDVPSKKKFTKSLHVKLPSVDTVGGSHIVYRVGDDTTLTILEELAPEKSAKQWSHGVELIIGKNAHVTYISLSALNSTEPQKIFHCSSIEQGGSVHWCNLTVGTAPITHSLSSSLIGDNARSSVDWAAYARREEHFHLSTHNSFFAKNGGGEITMRAVAEEKAKVKCLGMIEIGEQGQGTDTYLTEDVLMLDATAKIDAIPALEIRTNDVKASHSATIARLTEEELFYIASRGISPTSARKMYLLGYLESVLEHCEKDVQERALLLLDEKYAR